MPFRSILVPLDGSPFSEYAIPYALSLASRSGASVELVHGQEMVSAFDVPAAFTPEQADHDATEQSHRYLADVARRVTSAAPSVTISTALLLGIAEEASQKYPDVERPDSVFLTTTLLEGSIADAFCAYMAEVRPDLLVMTTHGRGPFSQFWFGSVTTDLIQRSTIPLLLVRPTEGPADLTTNFAPRRILIPLDGSSFGEQIIPLALSVGEQTDAKYRLLRVVPPVLSSGFGGLGELGGNSQTVADELQSAARLYLAGLTHQVPQLSAAERQVTLEWPSAVAILADADANSIDLIALETRGRSGLPKLILGSVADKVVRGAKVPVLLRRPVVD